MTISLHVDTRSVSASLQAARRQIPFAAATAVNDLAFQVQRAEAAGIKGTFKNPRPFTARSTQVNKASKPSPTATVFIRPQVAKYLAPYEYGGDHVLPGTALLDPVDVRLDQYGQLPKGIIAKLDARPDIFIGTVETKSGPITGVWQRLQMSRRGKVKRRSAAGGLYHPEMGRLKLLIRFGNALPVTKNLEFHHRAATLIRSGAPGAFAVALIKALASAK